MMSGRTTLTPSKRWSRGIPPKDEGRGFAAGGAEARGQETAISILARDRGRRKVIAGHRVQITARAHVVAARRGVDGRQEEHAVGAQEDVRRMRRRGRLTFVYL